MTLPATVSHTVQQTQEWLKELRDNADLDDEAAALSVLRAVLHQLRDRLTLEEAIEFGAQLPTLLRGIYYEGWRPSRTPERIRSKQKFLDEVLMKLLPRPVPPEQAVRDVFALIAHHCDPGEVSQVIGQLPADIKQLWPETARTYQQRI
ncbi:conserved protein of unknown function [Candidatus Filomicrobium marinum]|uniref:DUF2267 domain-containing protein n=2 Tax=Filomicrobium TaxID=119044 RepID=A0A0D6JHE9_9HYPH|nr:MULTISPECIES: DUF2267 domain-containing protein [Filomicrobium]MCV0369798.1 DUF2267 domain-containing protein [Filomicrobium sp.]CFX50676.1 conserved protein of unknown function [Candidatus Filomicrobium marinum]CPR20205.1 conserved protein of unknown function [Candidatus Filomicrobium marinum]SDP11952.1 Uncharacterized conserved protein, DUF2267 family [Filomicrobium insigne]